MFTISDLLSGRGEYPDMYKYPKVRYRKYAKYRHIIDHHIGQIIDNIESSKDGHIRIKTNDIIIEMGPDFSGSHYTSIFTGLKYALFKEGINIDVEQHLDGDNIFVMRFANRKDNPSINLEEVRKKLNIRAKSKRKCRNKNLDPDSSCGFGYISEVLTAKFLGIKTCFDITGNFNHRKFDMYQHEDFGRIDSKGSKLFYYEGCYYWIFTTRKNNIPDFFFCIGYNDTRTEVMCVYIIPNENIITNAIYINKNWNQHKDPYYWYKQDPKPWNDLFHTLKLEDCPVLKTRS